MSSLPHKDQVRRLETRPFSLDFSGAGVVPACGRFLDVTRKIRCSSSPQHPTGFPARLLFGSSCSARVFELKPRGGSPASVPEGSSTAGLAELRRPNR